MTPDLNVRRIACAFLLLSLAAPAQGIAQSAATGPEGSSSIGLTEREFGAVQLTTADKAAKLTIGRPFFDSAQTKIHWYNFAAGAKIKDDLASLFRKGSLSPDATASFDIGYNLATSAPPNISATEIAKCQTDSSDAQSCINEYLARLGGASNLTCAKDPVPANCFETYAREHPVGSRAFGLWLTGGVEAVAGQYNLFAADMAFDSQVKEEIFFGPGAYLGLNAWAASVLGTSLVGGIRAGIARENNADELKTKDVEESATYTGPDGITQRRVLSKSTVFEGDYAKYTGFPAKLDLIVAPHGLRNLAFNGLARADMARGRATELNLGTGIIILKGNNPLTPLGSIAFTVDDILGDKIKEDAFISHVKINLLLNVAVPRIR